jgi:hypothetical protein
MSVDPRDLPPELRAELGIDENGHSVDGSDLADAERAAATDARRRLEELERERTPPEGAAMAAMRAAPIAALNALAEGFPGLTVGPVLLVALVRERAWAVTLASAPTPDLLEELDATDRHALADALGRLAATVRPIERTP